MKQLRKFFNFWNVVRIVAFATLAITLVYPFVTMLKESFVSQDTGGFTLANYFEFFKYPYYYKTLLNSMSVVLAATFFSTLIGLPMAYITTRYNIWGKSIINIMIILSLLSPPFIGAYSWILLLGRNGFITNLFRNIGIELPPIYGWTGIVLVFSLKFFPYVYLFVSGALKSMDSSIEEAAENLGVSGFKKLMTITFPLILPTITAGALMVFMTSLADFGTPMLIGEGYKVLPVLIYEEYMSEIGGNATIASMLSVIIIICAMAILFVQKFIIAKKSYMMSALRPPKVIALKGGKRFWATFVIFLVAGVAMVQQVVVVITSFIKTKGPIFTKGFSLDSYRMIINKLSTNISNTFLYSTIAIIIMVIAGLLLSYLIVRRKSKVNGLLDILIMFPYVIPGAVLGISLLVAFNDGPIVLSGTATILIIAYVIRKLPYTIRSSTAILYQIDPSIEEASINLGVSPMKTFFKTTARLMAPGVLSGAVLSWITTINELSSSVILYTGRTGTISVAIYTEVVRASFGTAAALASILTVTTIISILVFNKISGGRGITM
ncbi:iron ABC transporter permease [Vallitalea pronyensis]|uniref:Iron ABC transporter permease n=1 Tax=Vallitalea pronyensis TaxID=1348613 RepID=A0A8J8SFL4_9FIRM|nr:iron ABC transporter permease [Vallitalea pronyensis]QUI21373.1 iron ABC transporter permease [Vallitalea pronyensis]